MSLWSRREVLSSLAALPLGARMFQPPARLQVGIVSRHLQWTTLEDAIELAHRAGYDAIEWNVRTGGHVPPDRVEEMLPRAVELTRKAGLAVPMIYFRSSRRRTRVRSALGENGFSRRSISRDSSPRWVTASSECPDM